MITQMRKISILFTLVELLVITSTNSQTIEDKNLLLFYPNNLTKPKVIERSENSFIDSNTTLIGHWADGPCFAAIVKVISLILVMAAT
jgi:hypothetical protein